jgi:P-type conjugative transfer protein TrbJ
MRQAREQAKAAEIEANKDLIKDLNDRLENMEKRDTQELKKLQDSAQNADGHMKALAAANQFAAKQALQITEIHKLLVQERLRIATKEKEETDREAQRKVLNERGFGGTYTPSPQRPYRFEASPNYNPSHRR